LRLVGCGEQQVLETDGVMPPLGRHAYRTLNRLQRSRRKRD
jgi:hypothetical protein